MNLSFNLPTLGEETYTELTLSPNFFILFLLSIVLFLYHHSICLQPNPTFVLVLVLHLSIFKMSNMRPVYSYSRHPFIGFSLFSSSVLVKRTWGKYSLIFNRCRTLHRLESFRQAWLTFYAIADTIFSWISDQCCSILIWF